MMGYKTTCASCGRNPRTSNGYCKECQAEYNKKYQSTRKSQRVLRFNLDAFAKLANPDSIKDYIEEGLYSEFYRSVHEFKKEWEGEPKQYLINVTVYEVKEGSL